ncbi:MAG: pyridoxal-phosphate dependent enzyme [Candidatus Eisenbacteria bacterium]|nr:pyridoxal-phosphate dependent enzyme [Candidatus Eisenbacteria bacterium]
MNEESPPILANGVTDPALDGATPQEIPLSPDLAVAARIARDRTLSLEDRLESFEDIIDSEVGDTSLTRARNIEREFGIRQLYLKFEGGNPTGSQKDRIAFAQAMDALRRGYDAVTLATCGNYGASVALAASLAGLECFIYIPETYHTRRVKEMIDRGGKILRVPGDYEAAVFASRERADRDEIYDANPGGANTRLQLRSYGDIANEIYDELRDAPAIFAAPVSNGTTLAGIYKGFLSLSRRGKTSRLPRLVAGSSFGKNPIVRAFTKNMPHCEDLIPQRVRETSINEPLVNWHSIDGDLALEAIRETGGWAANASDKSLLTYSKLIREREGLNTLPASTAGLVALLEQHKKEPLPNDRYVILLTGKR